MEGSMMHIPLVNVGRQYTGLHREIDAAYHRVIRSGSYVLGAEVEAFEQEFARYCGT